MTTTIVGERDGSRRDLVDQSGSNRSPATADSIDSAESTLVVLLTLVAAVVFLLFVVSVLSQIVSGLALVSLDQWVCAFR